jgi:hypothetical protein
MANLFEIQLSRQDLETRRWSNAEHLVRGVAFRTQSNLGKYGIIPPLLERVCRITGISRYVGCPTMPNNRLDPTSVLLVQHHVHLRSILR